MHHGFNGLPGPLGQQPRADQPQHCLLQRVVAALRLAPDILRPGRRGQRIQHRAHDGRALRGQVPGQHPGAAERGLHPDGPVRERLILLLAGALLRVPVLVLDLVFGEGAGVDLPGQPGQVRHIRAARRRPQQDRIRVFPALLGQLVRPAADGPRDRLRDLPGGQRRGDLRMRGSPLHPRGVPDGGALGDLGLVDQPRPRAVIRIRGVPLPGGERGQDRGPRRRPHRGDLLQHLQAVCLGLRRHRGSVRGSQVAKPGAHHVHRLASRSRPGTHLGSPPSEGMLTGLVLVAGSWVLL